MYHFWWVIQRIFEMRSASARVFPVAEKKAINVIEILLSNELFGFVRQKRIVHHDRRILDNHFFGEFRAV